MHQFGLKLWSTNLNYIDETVRLFEDGFFQYLEIFAVPGSFYDTASRWSVLKIPCIIHAPHFSTGLNFAKKDQFGTNKRLAEEALRFADKLNAEIVIFHPGVDGHITQTAEQIKKIFDSRMVVENKPYFSYDGKFICNGNSPQDIEFLITQTGIGFCFDFAHAICAANAYNIDRDKFLNKFMKFNPKIFHLSDNDILSMYDDHRHFGFGSYDIRGLMKMLPGNAMVSLETPKSYSDSLRDFMADVRYLRSFCRISMKDSNDCENSVGK